MTKQQINPLDFEIPAGHSLVNLYLYRMVFSFAFIDEVAQERLSQMIQQMPGTVSANADVDYILSSIPLKVESNAVCVNPAWIDALYSSEIPISSVPYLSHFRFNAHSPQSEPSTASIADITRALKSNWTFDQIVTRFRISPKQLSEVSKTLNREEEPPQTRPRGRSKKVTNAVIIEVRNKTIDDPLLG
jgi:hypothetical protein